MLFRKTDTALYEMDKAHLTHMSDVFKIVSHLETRRTRIAMYFLDFGGSSSGMKMILNASAEDVRELQCWNKTIFRH